MDLPIEHSDFPVRYVSLPEGNIFPYKLKPSSYWGFSIYGNPHM